MTAQGARRLCSVEGCERAHHSRSFCLPHYKRVRRTGDPGEAEVRPPVNPSTRTCSIDGCERKHAARGWCWAHFQRYYKTLGDPGDAEIAERVPGRYGPLCGIDGCRRPHNARGLCKAHHSRLIRNGDTGEAEVREVNRDRPKVCQLDGCERKHHAHGWCRAHAGRVRRNGDPGDAKIRGQVSSDRMPEGLKWCPGCKQTLTIDLFGKNRSTKDGLQFECRECKRERNAKRYDRWP